MSILQWAALILIKAHIENMKNAVSVPSGNFTSDEYLVTLNGQVGANFTVAHAYIQHCMHAIGMKSFVLF